MTGQESLKGYIINKAPDRTLFYIEYFLLRVSEVVRISHFLIMRRIRTNWS